MNLKDALTLTNALNVHAQKCEGTVTHKTEDPETGKITKTKTPCTICAKFSQRMGEIPVEFLSACLEEPPPPRATFSLATLLVKSVFQRGTHRSRRAQRDLIVGMKRLREYQDRGGKLLVSH